MFFVGNDLKNFSMKSNFFAQGYRGAQRKDGLKQIPRLLSTPYSVLEKQIHYSDVWLFEKSDIW